MVQAYSVYDLYLQNITFISKSKYISCAASCVLIFTSRFLNTNKFTTIFQKTSQLNNLSQLDSTPILGIWEMICIDCVMAYKQFDKSCFSSITQSLDYTKNIAFIWIKTNIV